MSLAGVIVGGPFAWTGVVLFVGILIDTAIRKQSSSTMHGNDGETLANPAFQNMVMYMMLPVFVLLQLALAWRVYGYMTGMPVEVTSMIWGIIPFTSGIQTRSYWCNTFNRYICSIGIIYGHELSHTKGFAFLISKMTMALSGSTLCYAHVYNQHLELASEDDPATAPRGRTIYGHYMLSHIGQSKLLFNMEKERLARWVKDLSHGKTAGSVAT